MRKVDIVAELTAAGEHCSAHEHHNITDDSDILVIIIQKTFG